MKRPLDGFVTLNASDDLYGVGGPAMRGNGMLGAAIPPRVVKRELEALIAVTRRIAGELALGGNLSLANQLHVAAEAAEREGLRKRK